MMFGKSVSYDLSCCCIAAWGRTSQAPHWMWRVVRRWCLQPAHGRKMDAC